MASQEFNPTILPRLLGDRILITPEDILGNETILIKAGWIFGSPQIWSIESATFELVADATVVNRYIVGNIYNDEGLGVLITGFKTSAITDGQTKNFAVQGLNTFSSAWTEADFYAGYSSPLTFWGDQVLRIRVSGGVAGDVLQKMAIVLKSLNRREGMPDYSGLIG